MPADVAPALLRALGLFALLAAVYPLLALLERWTQLSRTERRRLLARPWLPIAVALKLITKRGDVPGHTDAGLHRVAPVIGLLLLVTTLSVLPIGPANTLFAPGADVSLGLVLGLLMCSALVMPVAGFASGNPLALNDGLRLLVVRISAFIVVGFAVLGVAWGTGVDTTLAVIDAQLAATPGALPAWGMILHPVGFVCAVFALALSSQRGARPRPDQNRDLIDSYTVASSGLTLLGHVLFDVWDRFVSAAFLCVVFFGGYRSLLDPLAPGHAGWFTAKTLVVATVLLVVRRFLPPLRHDQVLRVVWGVLIPLVALTVFLPRSVLSLIVGG